MVSILNDSHPLTKDGPEQTYYESGGGRKTFYALSFITLLPFFVSLPVMLTQRFMNGVLLDAWGFIILALGFTIIMLLVLFELIFSLRAKVDIGSNAVAFTLPDQGAGLTPTIFYNSRKILYDDIATVQTYCDCYGGAVTPIVLRGTRLILKTGERITLGFVNDTDDDPRFPFKTIARQIADRAGLPVTDIGYAKYALHQRLFGLRSGAPAIIPQEEIDKINRGHSWFLVVISVVMLILLLLGIGNDIMSGSIDLGERAISD